MPQSNSADRTKRSVIAVPPLARRADLTVDPAHNRRLIDHLVAGGVTTLLYGGNANFYHIGLHEYAAVLDLVIATADGRAAVVPSAGPEYGRLVDQAAVLRSRPVAGVMVLPTSAVSVPAGVVRGILDFAERLGRKVVVYLKSESYLGPADVERLVGAGVVDWIKYAIVREDPARDPFLAELVERVDPRLIVSGIGEPPALAHLRTFGLTTFTSGSVCIAPALSTRLLRAMEARDWDTAAEIRSAYLTIEGLRDRLGPIPVLHEAVRLAGIAETGPMLPLLANLPDEHHAAVAVAARALREHEAGANAVPT